MKEGGGGGEGFFARSLTLAPRSLLLHRTEALATQANPFQKSNLSINLA